MKISGRLSRESAEKDSYLKIQLVLVPFKGYHGCFEWKTVFIFLIFVHRNPYEFVKSYGRSFIMLAEYLRSQVAHDRIVKSLNRKKSNGFSNFMNSHSKYQGSPYPLYTHPLSMEAFLVFWEG